MSLGLSLGSVVQPQLQRDLLPELEPVLVLLEPVPALEPEPVPVPEGAARSAGRAGGSVLRMKPRTAVRLQ